MRILPELSRAEILVLVLTVVFEVIYIWLEIQSQARLL
jgi:hypothetical protein